MRTDLDIKLCRECKRCGQLAKLDYTRNMYCRVCMTMRVAENMAEINERHWREDRLTALVRAGVHSRLAMRRVAVESQRRRGQ